MSDRELTLTIKKRLSGDVEIRTRAVGDPDDNLAMQRLLQDLLTADKWDLARHREFDMVVDWPGQRKTVRLGAP